MHRLDFNKIFLFYTLLLVSAISVSAETVQLYVDLDSNTSGIQTQRTITGLNVPFRVGVYIANVQELRAFGIDMRVNRNLFSYINDSQGAFLESQGGQWTYGSNPYLNNYTIRTGGFLMEGIGPSGNGTIYNIDFVTTNYGTHQFTLNDTEIVTRNGNVTVITNPSLLTIRSPGVSSPIFKKAVPRLQRTSSNTNLTAIISVIIALILIFILYINFNKKRNKRIKQSSKQK